jgi:hypothetical protein
MKKLLFISLFCCLLISCAKKDSTTDPTTQTETISTELQNLMKGKTIAGMNIGALGVNNVPLYYSNPTISFDQNFMIVDTTNYFALDAITQFYLTPSTSEPNSYGLEVTILAK